MQNCNSKQATGNRQQATKLNNSRRAGFTLIETIIGISIIGLVITAAAQLTSSSLNIGGNSLRKFAAIHLAEEGIEIVRNMRDSNWLRNKSWRENLAAGTYKIAENSASSWGQNNRWNLTNAQRETAENISLGQTTFKRLIEISEPETTIMLVISKITYTEHGSEKTAELTAQFTDWKKGPL